jgi:hypothetical protein
MYKRIQSIQVICHSLFLLDGDTHGLQLAIRDVYEAGVHVFIYGHT